VDDVEATWKKLKKRAESNVGEVVTAAYRTIGSGFRVGADPEGNFLELQSWRQAQAGRPKKAGAREL
jgi:predicted enzyme related to lactoylglutathione lyase